MTLRTTGIGLQFLVFLLAFATILAKVSGKWRYAGGILRTVLCIFYALVAIAGVIGLAASAWMILAGGGKALLLFALLAPLSLCLMIIGIRLFRFVLTPPIAPEKPLASSTGWGELEQLAERTRHAGVAPHLRPNALRKTGRSQ